MYSLKYWSAEYRRSTSPRERAEIRSTRDTRTAGAAAVLPAEFHRGAAPHQSRPDGPAGGPADRPEHPADREQHEPDELEQCPAGPVEAGADRRECLPSGDLGPVFGLSGVEELVEGDHRYLQAPMNACAGGGAVCSPWSARVTAINGATSAMSSLRRSNTLASPRSFQSATRAAASSDGCGHTWTVRDSSSRPEMPTHTAPHAAATSRPPGVRISTSRCFFRSGMR